MRDGWGRDVDYLRLSVTDRCDLRCRYCVGEAAARERAAACLTLEECVEISRAAVSCGVRKVRLTGGEPLLRQDLPELCRRLRALPGLEELCLTTNGQRLAGLAAELRAAGVDRVNVSLDTLDPERFARGTGGGRLEDTLAGIAAAEAAGFRDLKLNTVLTGGWNEDEIATLAALTLTHPWEVRFIELMPMGPCARWERSCFLPGEAVLERLPNLEPLPPAGVARRYRLPGAPGVVGLISPLSHAFCADCRRIRVTADGRLKGCLHSAEEVSLRGLPGAALEAAIRAGIAAKPACHHLDRRPSDTPRTMNRIGG